MTSFLYCGLRQNEAHVLLPVTLSSRDGRLQSSTKSVQASMLSFVLPRKPMHVLMMLPPMLCSWCMIWMCALESTPTYMGASIVCIYESNCASLHNLQKYPSLLRSGVSLSNISTIYAPLRCFGSPFVIIVSFLNVFYFCLNFCFRCNQCLWQSK
jgi:hypothetical protein